MRISVFGGYLFATRNHKVFIRTEMDVLWFWVANNLHGQVCHFERKIKLSTIDNPENNSFCIFIENMQTFYSKNFFGGRGVGDPKTGLRK